MSWDSPPDPKLLRLMEQTLAHRGPDEGSVWSDDICGFAHRRLRIIDLSPLAGQPMSNETGELQVIFNGEIYNFPELRADLEKLGHEFKSQSDTEVLVHGYESWREQLFEKLRGMFALAIWDTAKQQLFFGRDRLGKKPFFFTEKRGRFVFGSELPVFRCMPDLELSISPAAFCEFIEFGYVQSPRTILNEIQQLPPGHFGILRREGLSLHSYWSLPEVPPRRRENLDLARAAELLEGPLSDAVRCRLISDVPLGCFLSGGTDSSLVAAHAQELVSGRLKTYTVGFENSPMNEAGYAAEIARHLGTDHHQIVISPESVINEFVDIFARAPEPIGDDSFLPTFLISRETHREVIVALSGDGGDELFCGYDKYKQFAAVHRLRRFVPQAARSAALSIAGKSGSDQFIKRLEAFAAPNDEAIARWLSTVWKQRELHELIAPEVRMHGNNNGPFSAAWNRLRRFPIMERFMLTDMATYLTSDILAKVDRASMAHGLEIRNPLLDQNFIGAAFQVPSRARPGKFLLKEMLAKRVPRKLFERPKHGFGMPVNDWYRGPLRHVLEHFTSRSTIEKRGLLSADTIRNVVQAHLSGRRNFGRKLHAIVAFEIWADQFFGKGKALA